MKKVHSKQEGVKLVKRNDGKIAKLGRPTKYTPKLAERICAELVQGKSLRAVCRASDMPCESAVRQWAKDDVEGFYAQYARARDIALDVLADEVIEIAENEDGDTMRDRLRFDARRWYLSKLAPKRYGDRHQIEHSGEMDVRNMSDEELDAEIERLAAKAGYVKRTS